MRDRVRSRLVAIGFAAVLFFGCGGEGFDKIRNIRRSGQAIICFGDSLTEGVGAGSGEDYPTVLSRHLAIPVLNAGQRGDTTALALERISDEVLSKNPRLVIVFLGGNDFLRQLPRQETRKNLEEIVRRVQVHGAMVVIAGMRLGFFTDEYAPVYEETARLLGALYIPGVMRVFCRMRNLEAIRFIRTAPDIVCWPSGSARRSSRFSTRRIA